MEIKYKQVIKGIKLTLEEKSSIEHTLQILNKIINTENENEDNCFEEIYFLADKAKDALDDFYYDDRIIVRE